jgi:phosphoribosylamine---glycine ligase
LDIRISTESALTVVLAAPGYPESPQTGGVLSISSQNSDPGSILFHAGTEQKNGQILSSGGRVMAVTGIGPDLARAAQQAYAAVGRVHFEGMHYRKDIGRKAFDLLAS